MAGPDFSALEQKYGLPPGFLAAQQQVESAGGKDLTSSAGAQGPAQLMPATARSLGVNPHDPVQAAEGQARLMRQNLDATGGDIDAAAMMYHGGTDRRNWGPLTRAYPTKILAALQNGQAAAPAAPQDAFEAAMSGHSDTASSDPFEAQMNAGKSGGNAPAPNDQPVARPGVSGAQGADSAGRDGSGNVPLAPGAAASGAGGDRQAPGGQGAGAAGADNNQSDGSGRGNLVSGFLNAIPLAGTSPSDFQAAISEGGQHMLGSGLRLAATGLDKLGITDNAVGSLDDIGARYQREFLDKTFVDPNSRGRGLGNFVGESAVLAPLAEVTPFAAMAPEGRLAARLAKYSDLALQGGIGGTIASGGDNILQNAEMGALLAPAVGAGISVAGKPLLAAGERLIGGAKSLNARMAEALRARMAGDTSPITSDFSVNPAFLKAEAPIGFDAQGKPVGPDYMGEVFDAQGNSQGLYTHVTDDSAAQAAAPAPVSPPAAPPAPADVMAAAIGNKASKSGIEATRDLPPNVAENYQRLVDQGVDPAEALREADIRGIGAQPTVGAVKRSPEDLSAMIEGAKQPTPEGRELSNQLAQNNAALHGTVQDMVTANGGVPAQGEAAQTAAQSLAQASDAARAKVDQAYTAARSAEGDARVSIDGLRELLNSPSYKAPTTAEGKQLVAGLNEQIAAMAKENGGRFSPDEIEQLNQAASRAYNPMGGGANHMVGEVKAALNESLDQLETAGPAFKQARALHRDWAKQYDDPQGIAKLIRRDANGNFVNDDNWRAAEGIIGSTSDKQFIQITRQLQKNGDDGALSRLKAAIIQRAYERASNNAADKLGNATLSGKMWFAELNKIGMPKLKALFTPQEIASLAHVGRAAVHMNEAIPGTVNTSNTASALIKALGLNGEKPAGRPILSAAGKGMKYGLHMVAGHTIPGVGNAGVELGARAAEKVGEASANRAQQKALAAALREQMDPAAARSNAAKAAQQAAEAMRRAALANSLARRIAPAIPADRRGQ